MAKLIGSQMLLLQSLSSDQDVHSRSQSQAESAPSTLLPSVRLDQDIQLTQKELQQLKSIRSVRVFLACCVGLVSL